MNDRRSFLQQSSGLAAALAFVPDAFAASRPTAARGLAPIQVGVIGIGKRGREILGELGALPEVEVKALVDAAAVALRRGGRLAGGAQAYERLDDALEKESGIGAWIVATPTPTHRAIAEQLIAAGKHVYCEAPLAGSIEDAKALVLAARGARTIFQVGHTARTNPVYDLARSFYRSGSVKDLIGGRLQHHEKNSLRLPPREGADDRSVNWRLYRDSSLGLVGELGSHQLDAFLWFTERLPLAVSGTGSIALHADGREMPDTELCIFELEKGLRLVFDGTLANSYEAAYEQFSGTMGTIKMAQRFGWLFKEADAEVQGWEVYASRQRFHDEEGITLIADATKLASQGKLKEGIGLPHPPLRYALESFLAAIREGKAPACDALHGYVATVLAAKAAEAIRSGARVEIPAALYQV
jgi:predicted dehydrogenase